MEIAQDCIFCKIARHELPAEILHEDSNVVAFLSVQPTSKGHTVVIPREHSERFDQSSLEAASALFLVVHSLGPRVQSAMQADGYNIGVNTGAAAGQLVLHTHVHIIPRHVEDKLGHWSHGTSTPEELAAVAAAIRAA
jgi:histidine triad (HIT) family protein